MSLNNAALIVIDVQNDFCPGGSLAVPEGDKVVPIANKLLNAFKLQTVVLTQDWHPGNHGSFAVNAGMKPFEYFTLNGLTQVAWPVHCQQGTHGAELHRDLNFDQCGCVDHIVKGTNRDVDSYSAFYDNRAPDGPSLLSLVDRGSSSDTGLYRYLKERSISKLYLMGLATDYCVRATAFDSQELGFRTSVVIDGCRAVDPTVVSFVIEEFNTRGIEVTTSDVVASLA